MRAVWYDRPGPAAEVLQVGELPDPEPEAGEVRVRLTRSGINPGDTKKRADWVGYGMPFPRVIPHSDGAGVIDAAGAGVAPSRLGKRVWVYGAQSYRPFGTAAQWTVLPAAHAVDLPDEVSDDVGACLGIPGITAHRAVFADGPVTGQTVLVHGVLGGVWPMLFNNITIRLLGSDDFPQEAKQQAAADLTTAARQGALSIPIGVPLSLEQAAEGHNRVDAGSRERVLLAIAN